MLKESDLIIRLIFEHGAFTATDTQATAQALCWYSVGLFAYAANKVMVPVFYATGNICYPVIGSFLGVAANLAVINLVIATMGHRGIAFSTFCAMMLNFVFLSVVLYRKLHGYPLWHLVTGLGKIFCAGDVVELAAAQAQQEVAAGGVGGQGEHGAGVLGGRPGVVRHEMGVIV